MLLLSKGAFRLLRGVGQAWLWGFWGMGAVSAHAQPLPILPEVQIYHSVGTRNSSYTTLSGGLAIHLFEEVGGPHRYLHLLGLQVPREVSGMKMRVGRYDLEERGQGFELGLHDQWDVPQGKSATLSVRRLEWERVSQGGLEQGPAALDQLHMGWSWESGVAPWLVWLLGLDISTLHLPHERPMELQFALGFRTSL